MEAITIQKVGKNFAIGKNCEFGDFGEKDEYFEMVNAKEWWSKVSKSKIMLIINEYCLSYTAFWERKTISHLVKSISILKNINLGKRDVLKEGRQLFLKIQLSNLVKIVAMVKM